MADEGTRVQQVAGQNKASVGMSVMLGLVCKQKGPTFHIRTKWRYSPEDGNIRDHGCKNLPQNLQNVMFASCSVMAFPNAMIQKSAGKTSS
jgi:hypothetical protein